MSTIVPVLCGRSFVHTQRDVLFTELVPITDGTAVMPKPDLFDGLRLDELGAKLLNDELLRSVIVTSKHLSAPVAPNFFMETKGKGGTERVGRLQAVHDGAYGSRAMHALRNHHRFPCAYDHNAYVFSVTYCHGRLTLYAHHIMEPLTYGTPPRYCTTFLEDFTLTRSWEDFLAGAKAFRNARDMADRYRKEAVEIAHTS